MNQQQASIKLLLCEDDTDKLTGATSNLQNHLPNWEILTATTYDDALTQFNALSDNDVISIDSRLPNENDGRKIIENIVKKGCKCLILWHSPTPIPEGFNRRCQKLETSWSRGQWTNLANEINTHYQTWLTERDQVLSDFRPPINPETIIALSILCQGYLAVHPNNNLNKELRAYLPEDVSEKITETEGCEWWQKPFPNETKDTFITKITAEWKLKQLPTEASNLIKAIYGNQPINDVKIVEEAYKAIAARLTSL